MKTIATTLAALLIGTAAHATTPMKVINGCSVVPIPNTAGPDDEPAWQRVDPTCAALAAHAGNGPRAIRASEPEEPEEPGEPEAPPACKTAKGC